jgi:2-phosphosulfolactate phosphatase
LSLLSAGQTEDAYRFDWGSEGLHAIGQDAAVIVIVDVLSFTSAVDVAVGRGGIVYPFPSGDPGAADFATDREAILTVHRNDVSPFTPWSMSPRVLIDLPQGTRLVMPSINGATLVHKAAAFGVPILAGCLRNATAVASRATTLAAGRGAIAIVAAGERWYTSTGPLRPSVEDFLGAGAVLHALDPSAAVRQPCCSPEAAAARSAFASARYRLVEHIARSSSGRELLAQGWADDVGMAAAHDVSTAAPLLQNGAFS